MSAHPLYMACMWHFPTVQLVHVQGLHFLAYPPHKAISSDYTIININIPNLGLQTQV